MTSDVLARSDIRIGGERVEISPHNCFACGDLNAHGLRLVLHTDDERCWTELSLPSRFEGWEGIAHGGILCTILDEVMAWALVSSDSWGLTARLSVDFRRPVSIGAPLRAEGWLVRSRRRLFETAGRIVDAATGDELARATATYVAAPEDRKRDLKARYGFRLAAGGDGDGQRSAGAESSGTRPATGTGPVGGTRPVAGTRLLPGEQPGRTADVVAATATSSGSATSGDRP